MSETDFQNVQNNLKGLIIFVQKVMKITYILAKNLTLFITEIKSNTSNNDLP